ncbi:MAG TPA: N,N-dimethylformamidase beta subunit family domain-containing protein [Thermoanaerobaculia bacterium]|jgi:hypothetical protein
MPHSRAAFLLSFLCVFAATSDVEAARRRAARHPSITTNVLYTQGGYADRTSVVQGSSINFHIATSSTPFAVEIVNLASPDTVLRTVPNLTSAARDCTGLSSDGCGWPVTMTLDVPANWPSGYYAARFPTGLGQKYIFFVVAPAAPGSTAKTVVAVSTHTYLAYNSFGNLNVYPSNSPNRVGEVSYDRPYHDNSGLGRFPRWDKQFLDFATANNIAIEVVTDSDLEDPTLLAQYNLLVLIGHSEYWTATARANVETFSANGGHIAVFGGNTMWWQVRLADEGRTMLAYKDAARDPLNGINDSLLTVNFYAEPVNRPENLVVGASFRHGGYTNRARNLPIEQRVGYTVTDATSWVFEGLNLQPGAQFGKLAAGAETDGVLFNCGTNGLAATPDGSDGTPLNYRILATVPAEAGYGTIGLFTNAQGGVVFNAGTQDWANALTADPVVAAMTRNVLRRLGAGERFQYDPVQSAVRLRDTFNCAMPMADLLPGWRGEEAGLKVASSCAYEGPSGLEIGGDLRTFISRNLAPTGTPVSMLHSRFYINTDRVTGGDSYGLYILTMRRGTTVTRVARVELDPTDKEVRLVQYNPDGSTGNRSDWVKLGSGWHSVEVGWRSPGALTFRIDGGTELTVDNPHAGQTVNEVQLFVPSDPAGTNGRLCIDALAAGLEPIAAVAPLR